MVVKNKTVLSYESSKWYVKLWRTRWYLYAILLYLEKYLRLHILIDLILNQQIDDDDRKNIRTHWKDIKRHIELSKMYKFSTKTNYERED